MELVKISKVKPNENNPRLIKDSKFKKLVTSITQSPAFMELNPLKVDENMRILGGNMRYKACLELNMKEVQINVFTKEHADTNNIARKKNGIKEATYEEQCKEFIIKDNVGYGEHDWDILANDWDIKELEDWGLDGFPFENGQNESKDISDSIESSFRIEIELENEEEQEKLYNKLINKGHICRILTL